MSARSTDAAASVAGRARAVIDPAFGGWRDFADPALPPLLQAAADCFVESGYHGTTTRTIAARAGLSVPGYYHHYPSKTATLIAIMEHAMTELYERSVRADAEASADVTDRLRAHVECLVLFHAYRADLAFLASSEIRALPEPARREHIARRDRQQQLFETIVGNGVDAGVLHVNDPRSVVRAITTMCTGVSQWYRLSGPMVPERLARQYADLSARMLGQPEGT